ADRQQVRPLRGCGGTLLGGPDHFCQPAGGTGALFAFSALPPCQVQPFAGGADLSGETALRGASRPTLRRCRGRGPEDRRRFDVEGLLPQRGPPAPGSYPLRTGVWLEPLVL